METSTRWDVYKLEYDQEGKAIGFTIPDCQLVFLFNKQGGWYDQFGVYWDSKGRKAQKNELEEEQQEQEQPDTSQYFENKLKDFNLKGIQKEKLNICNTKRLFANAKSHILDNFKLVEERIKQYPDWRFRIYFKSQLDINKLKQRFIQEDIPQNIYQIEGEQVVYSSSKNTYKLIKGKLLFKTLDNIRDYFQQQVLIIRFYIGEEFEINQIKTLDYLQNLLSEENQKRQKIIMELKKKIEPIETQFLSLRIQNVWQKNFAELEQFLLDNQETFSMVRSGPKEYKIKATKLQSLKIIQQQTIIRHQGYHLKRQIIFVYVQGQAKDQYLKEYHYFVRFRTFDDKRREDLEKLIKEDLGLTNLIDYYNLKSELDQKSKRTKYHTINFEHRKLKNYFINFQNKTFEIVEIAKVKPQ